MDWLPHHLAKDMPIAKLANITDFKVNEIVRISYIAIGLAIAKQPQQQASYLYLMEIIAS